MDTQRPTSSIRWIALGAVALGAFAIASPALAGALRPAAAAPAGWTAVTDRPNVISVRGTGRVTVTPDMATVFVGADAQAKTAAEAQSEASRRMAAAIAALKELGIADADLSTQQIMLNPVYDYSANTQRLTGYQASQTLQVKVHRIDQVGPVIDAAVTAGATTVNSVSFSVSDPSGATDQARSQAVADARHRADGLASAAGVTLGAPVNIVEGAAAPPPPIMYQGEAFRLAADQATTPVQIGTTEIVVEVSIDYAIG